MINQAFLGSKGAILAESTTLAEPGAGVAEVAEGGAANVHSVSRATPKYVSSLVTQ